MVLKSLYYVEGLFVHFLCHAERGRKEGQKMAKRLFCIVACLLFLIAAAPAEVSAGEPQVKTADRPQETREDFGLVERVLNATALLYKQDAEGSMTMVCTTTAFERDPRLRADSKIYYFATAAHCVASDNETHERVDLERSNWFITFDEAETKSFIPARVVAAGYQHRGDDFAVLEVVTDRDITVIQLAAGKARLGEEIVNIASPGGFGKQLFTGHVSMSRLERPVRIRDIDWENFLLLQVGAAGGSSGSAVVSLRQTAIVGFLVGTIGGGDSVNIVAVPSYRFKEFWETSQKGTYKWFKTDDKGVQTLNAER